jgi:hypothetical protein
MAEVLVWLEERKLRWAQGSQRLLSYAWPLHAVAQIFSTLQAENQALPLAAVLRAVAWVVQPRPQRAEQRRPAATRVAAATSYTP